jgi:hypothetical protein
MVDRFGKMERVTELGALLGRCGRGIRWRDDFLNGGFGGLAKEERERRSERREVVKRSGESGQFGIEWLDVEDLEGLICGKWKR